MTIIIGAYGKLHQGLAGSNILRRASEPGRHSHSPSDVFALGRLSECGVPVDSNTVEQEILCYRLAGV